MIITIMANPVRYMIPARTGCIYFLKSGEREKISTDRRIGVVIPNRINQKRLFSSGSSNASRKANTPKKNIASTIENLNGFKERLK
jgi:hypothetical protein